RSLWIAELGLGVGTGSAPAKWLTTGRRDERSPADDSAVRGLHGARRDVVLPGAPCDRSRGDLRRPLPGADGGPGRTLGVADPRRGRFDVGVRLCPVRDGGRSPPVRPDALVAPRGAARA